MLVYTEGWGWGGAGESHWGWSEQSHRLDRTWRTGTNQAKHINWKNKSVYHAGEHLQRPDPSPGGETWTWIIPGPDLGKTNFLHVSIPAWQQRAALWRMAHNDWKLSTSVLQPAVSSPACLPVYGMPPSQRGIVLLLLYTMWVVKPENELPLYQQHLVLVHFVGWLLMQKYVSTSQSRGSPSSLRCVCAPAGSFGYMR